MDERSPTDIIDPSTEPLALCGRLDADQAATLEALLRRVSSLGHKINNPLTSLMGRAQLLRMKSRDPDTCKVAKVIEESSGRIAGYVRELSELVREARSELLGQEPPQDPGTSSGAS